MVVVVVSNDGVIIFGMLLVSLLIICLSSEFKGCLVIVER